MKEKTLYSPIAKMYGDAHKLMLFNRGVKSALKKAQINCPANGKILDMGCGDGVVGLNLLERFKRAKLFSTDIEENFLHQVLNNAKNNKVKNQVSVGFLDVSSPNKAKTLKGKLIYLKPKSFDIISASGTIGYSKNQIKTIKILLGMIKKGGYFVDLEMKESIFGNFIAKLYSYNLLPHTRIKNLFEKEGFEIMFFPLSFKQFPVNLTRTLIVARKK